MLVIAWHILAEHKPNAELGVDFHRRAAPEAHARRLALEMEKHGFDVTFSRTPPPDPTPSLACGSAVELTPAYQPGFSCQGHPGRLQRQGVDMPG
jgi:hypothetical protein